MTQQYLHDFLNRWYNQSMYTPLIEEFYQGSDFHNLGYWTRQIHSPREASENLMEKLLSFIPEKKGNILDVACGKGATTRYLLKYYPPGMVTGINISEKQLETCRVNVPECQFFLMNAADLKFDNQSFDNIICVESACHFDTRQRFFEEAYRVLKPGGRLVLSDILVAPSASPWVKRIPPDNILDGIEKYEAACKAAGFSEIKIVDATRECVKGFFTYGISFVRQKLLRGEINRPTANSIKRYMLTGALLTRTYALVSASKPPAPVDGEMKNES